MQKGRDIVAPILPRPNSEDYFFFVVSAFVESIFIVESIFAESVAAGAGAIAGAAAVSDTGLFSALQAATANTAATRARRFIIRSPGGGSSWYCSVVRGTSVQDGYS